MKTKAAIMRSVGDVLSIEDIDLDDPGPFEVVVRVAAAGVCHSDAHYLNGSFEHPLPTVLGHESAGVVERVGDQVTHVVLGDHVITSLSASCGSCSYCLSDRSHLCSNQESTRRSPGQPPRLSQNGGNVHQFLNLSSFAERMLVHENAVVRVTREIDLATAALLGCGAATGLGAVLNTAGVRSEETVAVIGCGGVGLAAVQGARIAGAASIIAVDTVEEKLEMAKALGATATVNATEQDPVLSVLDLTDGVGVDHVIEAIGGTRTAEQAFEMTCKGGTATIVGLMPAGEKLTVDADLLFYERKIQGSVMGSNRFRIDIPRYIGMYLDGRLNLDDMVSRRMTLGEINGAFADMREGRGVRSLVVFD